MKNTKLNDLLYDTRAAKNKLGITYATLAHILGVSTDSLDRWFNNIQKPNPTNMYKLNWFVYLVLEQDTSLNYLLHYYDIAGMTLASNPEGSESGHFEPWNGDKFVNIFDDDNPDNKDDLNSVDEDDIHSLMKDMFDVICCDDYDDLADDYDSSRLAGYLKDYESSKQKGVHYLTNTFDKTLDLSACTYQEAIKRVNNLITACHEYIRNQQELLDFCVTHNRKLYEDVHHFISFSDFITDYHELSKIDERYDIDSGEYFITLSKYEDSKLKDTVKHVQIVDLNAYNDRRIILKDKFDSKISFAPTDDFLVKPIGSKGSNNYEFMIRFKGEYYVLSFKHRI